MKKTVEKTAVVRAVQGVVVSPTPPVQLKTIDNCRLEMARIYREMKTGKRDMSDGARLVYVLTSIAKMIELSQFEARMDEVEKRLELYGGNNHGNNT